MKKIYIVLTYTGTVLAKIVRFYTKKIYSHVSISLDKELERLYSFGRLNPYNPFWGGFVHEGLNIGTFKRFYKTQTAIYSLEVSDEVYTKIEKNILDIEKNKSKYKFNVIGLFAVSFKIRIHHENKFYCAEFIKYILKEEESIKKYLPDLIKPEDFKNIPNLKLEYEGILQKYNIDTII